MDDYFNTVIAGAQCTLREMGYHGLCCQSEHVHFWITLSRTARAHKPIRVPLTESSR